MNKKIYQNQDIQNELDGSVFFSGKQKSGSPHKENKTDVVTSSNDVITSPTDVTTGKKKKTTTTHNSTPHSLDVAKLQTIISAIAEVPTTAQNTPVRMSSQEKKDLDDFIYETLRKQGLQGNRVSISKLMRYSIRYVMQVHRDEFVRALTNALDKETQLPI